MVHCNRQWSINEFVSIGYEGIYESVWSIGADICLQYDLPIYWDRVAEYDNTSGCDEVLIDKINLFIIWYTD